MDLNFEIRNLKMLKYRILSEFYLKKLMNLDFVPIDSASCCLYQFLQ